MDGILLSYIILMCLLYFILRQIFLDDNENPKVFVKRFGYILISPDIKDHKEIVDKIRSITIAKSISFIIKNIILSILAMAILVSGIMYLLTRETKEETLENQYALVQNKDGHMINIIKDYNEYIMTTVIKGNNDKSVLKKISLGDNGDIENIEFIANNNMQPTLKIIKKTRYETDLISSTFNDVYRKNEKTEYTYIFTMPNDDVVKILNEVNSLKSR